MVGCTDINECTGINWCFWYANQVDNPRGYECHNINGNYKCDTCGSNEIVVDGLVDGDRCPCRPGFARNGADGICECIPGTSHCDNCGGPNTGMDRWNEFCICKEGYEGDPTVGCVDIDECERGIHHCNYAAVLPQGGDQWIAYQCRNIAGSYECDPCGKNASVVNASRATQ
jgi:hypothetical protein